MTPTTPTRPDFRTEQPDVPQWWLEMRPLEHRVLLTTMIVVIASAALYGLAQSIKVVDDFAANVITEVISIAITVTVIARLNRQEAVRQRKEELILQMGSPYDGFATEAVRLLGTYGWLTDGSVSGADLRYANLQGVNLKKSNLDRVDLSFANLQAAQMSQANLQGAQLNYANLQNSSFMQANLQGAKLSFANLQETTFSEANLKDAVLYRVNLQDAKLWQANLQGANLGRANLQDAKLWQANLQDAGLVSANQKGAELDEANLQGVHFGRPEFDETTTLPDRTIWSPDIDMKKFTDVNYPEFWHGFDLREKDLRNRDFANANLQGAILYSANLERVILRGANLQGAILTRVNFQDADLRGADLQGADLSASILPDGTRCTPHVDLRKFTDADHPDFWQPDWVKDEHSTTPD
ncbi:MAG: pentapeptide repeat-containing protein [Chloroflexi bacterium]|nr:pentapeptide repeat-containing protein [Chloroflexota bacterium]